MTYGTPLVLITAVWILSSGCATMIHGTTQRIPVSSTPDGAEVRVGDFRGTTPTTVELKRRIDHLIQISKDGYETATVRVERKSSRWTGGNMVVGVPGILIGGAVDVASGAQYHLIPESIHVTLQADRVDLPPKTSARQADHRDQVPQTLERGGRLPASEQTHASRPPVALPPPAPAAPATPLADQPRLALVIGNAAYAHSPLQSPVNDATDMAALLRQLGFSVTLLRDADYPTMDRAIHTFTSGVPRGSVGLVYFSGHGVQLEGQTYLIPVGEVFQGPIDVKYRAVAADWVLGRMSDAGIETKFLILDACRNNPLGRSWTRDLSVGLGPMPGAKGSLIAYATSPGKLALDGEGRHSPYTEQLLRQMLVPRQPVELMFKAVRRGVEQATNGQQTPWENSSLTGEFYFAGR